MSMAITEEQIILMDIDMYLILIHLCLQSTYYAYFHLCNWKGDFNQLV